MRKRKNEEDLINEELENLRYAWTYRGEMFDFSPDLKKYKGFVYEITNLINGKRYIGQKMFDMSKPIIVDGKKRRNRVESDWKRYYGSNDDLKNDVVKFGRENFKREILFLCDTKSLMNYYESYFIFTLGALVGDQFYNKWVSCKCSKKLIKLQSNPTYPAVHPL